MIIISIYHNKLLSFILLISLHIINIVMPPLNSMEEYTGIASICSGYPYNIDQPTD